MKFILVVTEISMLVYWLLAGLNDLGVISIPPEWMYSDYTNPIIVAWNWSFFPIDVLFSVTGLLALYGRFSDKTAQGLLIVSLTLMFCAGIMAISFWAIRGEFELFWWSTNIWLMVLPLVIWWRKPKLTATGG